MLHGIYNFAQVVRWDELIASDKSDSVKLKFILRDESYENMIDIYNRLKDYENQCRNK